MSDNQLDPIVIVGCAIRLPGGVDDVASFEQLLFEGRSAIAKVLEDRFDRTLYFDSEKGLPGKSYTDFGGCVSGRPLDEFVEQKIGSFGSFDLTHRQFAQVAAKAWSEGCHAVAGLNERCGVYVGHSGGTDQGGPLAMAMLAESAVDNVRDIESFKRLGAVAQQKVMENTIRGIRTNRPVRTDDSIHVNAYSAASLVSRLLGLGGPREVIDAACASSLLALSHASAAISLGRIDAAIVGGATYNNVDNLILFSQSQACSDRHSSPFDEGASGLISSEGYVAVVITRQSIASYAGLPLLGVLRGVGVASDGRGKSLWAPRTEGQQLAIRRGYPSQSPLAIDYLEAHATSTQVGDATELRSLASIQSASHNGTLNTEDRPAADGRIAPLLVGSVKSNLGHTLEAAGIVGLVKLLIAMRRGEIPATIHFKNPTPEFDWSTGNLRVVDRTVPWPSKGKVKRCGVNAFGIGGLNGHAVIESATATVNSQSLSNGHHASAYVPSGSAKFSREEEMEPIAIVGRGVVLPNAFSIAQFSKLLVGSESAIGSPSPTRWRGQVGVAAHHSPFHTPTVQGGYINEYQFNGQPYRIPPKQVQLANPVQMMLIDAVEQAIGEADGGKWLSDRTRTSVVIGAIFGGEFSNHLQIGLRLPEICRTLTRELIQTGMSPSAAADIATEYRGLMLRRYPALLDETGSFTASTLASRIAKSFDLMGGACAVDADDASGNLALMLGVDQLRSGSSDAVVCGVAQRSLDLVAFRDLDLQGRLARSGRTDEITNDCSRVLPGEGVAVVILKRLADALRDRQPILGLIDDIDCALHSDASVARHLALGEDAINYEIVRRIGYLAGAHGVVRLIAETIRWEGAQPSRTAVTAVAQDGFTISASIRHPSIRNKYEEKRHNGVTFVQPNADENGLSTTLGAVLSPQPNRIMNSTIPMTRTIRLEADNEVDFERILVQTAASPEECFARATARPSDTENRAKDQARGYSASSRFRGGIVAASAQELGVAVAALLKAWQRGERGVVIDRHLAVLWNHGDRCGRIAWAFPGQGSQYSAIPNVVSEDPMAKEYVASLDTVLRDMRLPPVSDKLDDRDQQLGNDIWWTQLWVLAVSATLADSLVRSGQRPDIVLGHSFGECGAALQAGIMTPKQAIRFAKLRSDAVVMTTGERGQLLSIRATPSRVESILASAKTGARITHHNAPEQTVIAGTASQIAAARQAFSDASIASIVIAVPAAFHSPAMEAARQVLTSSFGGERFRPPRTGYFSTIQGRYLAEPDEIRNSLIDQLTKPLTYCGAIERLVDDGCDLIIDVGPSDLLNRLHQSIVGSRALCVSLDGKEHSHHARLALVRLASECVAGAEKVAPVVIASRDVKTVGAVVVPAAAGMVKHADVEMVDVTRRGRSKSTSLGAQPRVMRESLPSQVNRAQPDVVSALAPRLNSNASEVAPSQPTAARQVGSPVPGAAVKGAPNTVLPGGAVDRFLVDLVVELTGYSADLIDFDADLEAELGVDSIKKAQIIGELAEWASIELDLKRMKLSDFLSLADIRKLASTSNVDFSELSSEFSRPEEIVDSGFSEPLRQGPLHLDSGSDVTRPTGDETATSEIDPIAALMIDFIVDQTGYSPSIIDMDADLEGELGIDSIKKAQLLGELASHFELEEIDLRRVRLADFPTLESIRTFIVQHSSKSVREPSAVDPSNEWKGRSSDLAASKKKMIRRALRSLVDEPKQEPQQALLKAFSEGELNEMRSQGKGGSALIALANDVGVLQESLWHWIDTDALQAETAKRTARLHGSANHGGFAGDRDASKVPAPTLPIPRRGTCRFALKVVNAQRLSGMPRNPILHGPSLIVGNNPVADAIAQRLHGLGVKSHRLDTNIAMAQLDSVLDAVWKMGETPHLFLVSAYDANAMTALSTSDWLRRREAALSVPFRVCQRWMQRMIDGDWMNRASLATVVHAGGDFGFSAARPGTWESGGLAGLTKAMLIEAWMRGFCETPMKVVDAAEESTVEGLVEGVFRELALPSHDEEVVVDGELRLAVRPEYCPLGLSEEVVARPRVTRGGNWVVSGGGRGITAMTSMALAEKYGLKLHLLGTAPVPHLTAAIRDRGASDRPALRREVMNQAQRNGENPIERWRDTEKAIEIEITLAQCRSRGIRAEYHSVDVSDAMAVRHLLDQIRHQHGPIRGVIHGAGAGQDARFDRKRMDKVEKCIRAKVDGCLALAEATSEDPLEWFVGFGSISGRFGANGHTDYSLANDMLAKVIGCLRKQRPEIRCLTFHWHAWGDIGMAAKPEAKLALEMIGMEFMPAEEGLAHFMAEFEFGGDQSEVLITDRNYIRKFFPGLETDHSRAVTLPMLDPNGSKSNVCVSGSVNSSSGGHPNESFARVDAWTVTLDPTSDRFLSEHCVSGRPTLPFVMALEMMAEAACWKAGGKKIALCRQAEAIHPLKFMGDDAIAVEVVEDRRDPLANAWNLQADLRRRDGRIVDAGRVHFRASFEASSRMPDRLPNFPSADLKFEPVVYLGPDAPIYHGESLQTLKSIAISSNDAVGKITAPSPVQLGGVQRPVNGWVIPCAVMDATLYASAILAFRLSGRPSLPVRFEEIHIGRSPEPGEPLQVHVRANVADDSGITLMVDLYGLNGDRLLVIRGYRIHWLL